MLCNRNVIASPKIFLPNRPKSWIGNKNVNDSTASRLTLPVVRDGVSDARGPPSAGRDHHSPDPNDFDVRKNRRRSPPGNRQVLLQISRTRLHRRRRGKSKSNKDWFQPVSCRARLLLTVKSFQQLQHYPLTSY